MAAVIPHHHNTQVVRHGPFRWMAFTWVIRDNLSRIPPTLHQLSPKARWFKFSAEADATAYLEEKCPYCKLQRLQSAQDGIDRTTADLVNLERLTTRREADDE